MSNEELRDEQQKNLQSASSRAKRISLRSCGNPSSGWLQQMRGGCLRQWETVTG